MTEEANVEKNKLYVGNLPYAVDDAKLAELFKEFGEVVEAKVIVDKYSGKSKGFGFVTMKDEAMAEAAIEAMNDNEVEGRKLKVNVARPLKPRE